MPRRGRHRGPRSLRRPLLATAPVLIGLSFLGLGLLLGEGGSPPTPDGAGCRARRGCCCSPAFYLALSSKPGRYKSTELFLVLLMAAIGVAVNPAVAFAVGLPLAYGVKHGWLKF